jgi:hypothetical protein
MRIPAAVLARMLDPGQLGGRVVARRFRCRCRAEGLTGACIRAATDEDGLCDGCRANRGGGPFRVDVLRDDAIESLPGPLDVYWPASHTSLMSAPPPPFPG